VTDSSKAGRVPAQRRLFKLEFRSLVSSAVGLDQEVESVQLAPEEFSSELTSAKQKLLKRLIPVNCLCCRRNSSK
jgi:hypothetical protein